MAYLSLHMRRNLIYIPCALTFPSRSIRSTSSNRQPACSCDRLTPFPRTRHPSQNPSRPMESRVDAHRYRESKRSSRRNAPMLDKSNCMHSLMEWVCDPYSPNFMAGNGCNRRTFKQMSTQRILANHRLHAFGKTIEPTAHVCSFGRKPDPRPAHHPTHEDSEGRSRLLLQHR